MLHPSSLTVKGSWITLNSERQLGCNNGDNILTVYTQTYSLSYLFRRSVYILSILFV